MLSCQTSRFITALNIKILEKFSKTIARVSVLWGVLTTEMNLIIEIYLNWTWQFEVNWTLQNLYQAG